MSTSLVAQFAFSVLTCVALLASVTALYATTNGMACAQTILKVPPSLASRARDSCKHMFLSPDPTCPRFLKYDISTNMGLGHQLTELLLGLRKARYLGLSYVYVPFTASLDHKDDYTFVNSLLGLPRLFDSLGAATSERVENILANTNASWTDVNGLQSPDGCNIFRSIGGWNHCRSNSTSGDCFFAPETAYLYQDAAICLRSCVASFGTAFDSCIFNSPEFIGITSSATAASSNATRSRLLSQNDIIVIWHVRVGDIVLHKPSDTFFEEVLLVLKEITQGYKVHLLLVGKGNSKENGTHSVANEYVEGLSKLVHRVWAGSQYEQWGQPNVAAPSLSFRDSFVAMMHADVLVGSGSSLPAIANLVSGEPLFLNHVMKNGYNYGSEMLADSADMESNGTILDSHRRLKVAIHERMRSGKRRTCLFAPSSPKSRR